jgi:hypothetical protein
MDAESVQNTWSNIAVTNKDTAKLHRVGSLYILTYDARKLKKKGGGELYSIFPTISFCFDSICINLHRKISKFALKKE